MHSPFRCEGCRRFFNSVDRLDRHRLLCLEDDAASAVLVRSSKAFSGYEGVVASQVGSRGDKWEAFFIHRSGYGHKRRRVGTVFDSREEAARAYSAECRAMLLEDLAEEEAAEAAGGGGAAYGGSGGAAQVDAESDSEGEDGGGGGGEAFGSNEYEVEAILGQRRARVRGNSYRTEYQVSRLKQMPLVLMSFSDAPEEAPVECSPGMIAMACAGQVEGLPRIHMGATRASEGLPRVQPVH